MNLIELQLKAFLEKVVAGEAEMPSFAIKDAARQFERALERQFTPRKQQEFRLRLSNIGRPSCQLWYEKNGAEKEPRPYSFPIKMVLGDTVEIITLAIIKAAGIDIEAINEAGEITVSGETIRGTSDITIDGKIWDIKSVSSHAFQQKYDNPFGYSNLAAEDDFGYVAQGVGYSAAMNRPFGGWIATNKESGEISVLEVPTEQDTTAVLEDMERNVSKVKQVEFPGRAFEDVPEVFNKKLTGNRILATACKYCDYKNTCWPNLQFLPVQNSKAANPDYRYYTHVEKKADA